VVLMRSDLTDVLTAIDLSRAVMSRILLNFRWACLYNFAAIPLAAGLLYPWLHVYLHPMVAALAMGASSVSVIVSSLMLKRWKKAELEVEDRQEEEAGKVACLSAVEQPEAATPPKGSPKEASSVFVID
jgi:Cu+-exporting ATPase